MYFEHLNLFRISIFEFRIYLSLTDIGTIEGVVEAMDDVINANFADVVDEINKLRADVTEIRTALVGAVDYMDSLKTTVNTLLSVLRKTGGCGVLAD